jgi:MoxR-like ATPase
VEARAPPALTSGALAANHQGVTMPAPFQALQQLRQNLAAQFPEWREVIEGTLYALLSSESVLLLGPPGTGKSSLVRAVAQAFGARYFERLLTKFTTPEEIFGP